MLSFSVTETVAILALASTLLYHMFTIRKLQSDVEGQALIKRKTALESRALKNQLQLEETPLRAMLHGARELEERTKALATHGRNTLIGLGLLLLLRLLIGGYFTLAALTAIDNLATIQNELRENEEVVEACGPTIDTALNNADKED